MVRVFGIVRELFNDMEQVLDELVINENYRPRRISTEIPVTVLDV